MKITASAIFPFMVLSIVGMLVIPLPPLLLDTLLAVNLVTAITVLIVSITVSDPLEFPAFAPALLLATLFRLALDVSATRLILSDGHVPGGAGEIIPAFGEFVVRGNLVIGIIIFAILITIQFIVIASGSQRVAEVAARFTLDAMPGKQMAIDAELHSGGISQDVARERRKNVQREADFFGAMDGAGKFVKGDAIAALIIVVLNLIGGVAVGLAYHKMSIGESVSTYALLTIGNALITTLPAFVMSLSMGMMVTRVAGESSLGADLADQILRRTATLQLVAVVALLLGCVPALPHFVFFALSGFVFLAARVGVMRERRVILEASVNAEHARRNRSRMPEAAFKFVEVDPIVVELGDELVALFSDSNREVFLDRMIEVRQMLAQEFGLVIPGIKVRDESSILPNEYRVLIREEAVARGVVQIGRILAIGSTDIIDSLTMPGEFVRDPAFNFPGKWIEREAREAAEAVEAVCFDVITVVGTHIAETARRFASKVIGRQELLAMFDYLGRSAPALAKEIGSERLPHGLLFRVYQELLRTRVWPRDPIATIEAILACPSTMRDPRDVAITIRRYLVPALMRQRQVERLSVVMLDPALERFVLDTWTDEGSIEPSRDVAVHIRNGIRDYLDVTPPRSATLVCSTPLLRLLQDFTERFGLPVDVFTFSELPPDIRVRPKVVITVPEESASTPVSAATSLIANPGKTIIAM